MDCSRISPRRSSICCTPRTVSTIILLLLLLLLARLPGYQILSSGKHSSLHAADSGKQQSAKGSSAGRWWRRSMHTA
jgi:hypothetical protein